MLERALARFTERPSTTLRAAWERLSRVPGGKRVFSRLVGRMAPYTGTIGAQVVELRPGYARLELRDRPQVRNHLSSVHAVALVNLAEETSGLAMLTRLPDDARGIITGLSMTYVKKARGTLTSECHADHVAATSEAREVRLDVTLRDASGAEVARAEAIWRLGPR